VVDAINAGVELLLLSYDGDKYYAAMYCLAKAARNHRVDAQMLSSSSRRLRSLRSLR
jgi:beta-N-acetylhexosaminidase